VRVKEVYDVTGTGDIVISVMTLALAAKKDLISTTEVVNFVTDIIIGKNGTATINMRELLKNNKGLLQKNGNNRNCTIKV
jgi:D-beta-D-heptose 7-phosphate kinase/D-beta-D-heptose 1-phosphate adenosyltransferase